jgi:hypothetical protein
VIQDRDKLSKDHIVAISSFDSIAGKTLIGNYDSLLMGQYSNGLMSFLPRIALIEIPSDAPTEIKKQI